MIAFILKFTRKNLQKSVESEKSFHQNRGWHILCLGIGASFVLICIGKRTFSVSTADI